MDKTPLLFDEFSGEERKDEEERGEISSSNGYLTKRDRNLAHKLPCIVTITSCFLMLSTQGFDYTFGNINPYVTSYLRNVTGENVDYTNTLWLYQTKNICNCLLAPLIGLLAHRIAPKLFLLYGILASVLFLFGTWYGLQHSFVVTWFAYGIVGGLPGSFLYPTCLKISAEWVPEKRGLVVGINLMGYGAGSFMWNALTTWYINSDNRQPDLHTAGDAYYTQKEVLGNVPSCFLVLGGLFTAMQLLCLLLIQTPPAFQTKTIMVQSVNDPGNRNYKELFETSGTQDDKDEYRTRVRRESGEGVNYHWKQNFEKPRTQKEDDRYQDVRARPGRESRERVNYHWRQVLRSRVFWTVWFMMMFSGLGVFIVIPLFKAFGQTFIADDHFLATVAMFSAISNAAGRPFWGIMADKYGPRKIALFVQTILSVLVLTFTTCKDTGEAAFFVWVCAMFFTMCGFFTMVPIITLSAFGPLHFNVNMGLVDSNGIIGAIIPAIIAPSLKNAFGWSGLFCVGFAGLCTGILLNLSLDLFKCGNGIPLHMQNALSLRSYRP